MSCYIRQDLWDHIAALRKPPAATSEDRISRRDTFQRLYRFGRLALEADPEVHPVLVRLYSRPIEAAYLTLGLALPQSAWECAPSLASACPLFGRQTSSSAQWGLFPCLDPNDRTSSLMGPAVTARLGTDVVLPWPWHVERYHNALLRIGNGLPAGAWRQDRNHQGYALWPLRVTLISQGNHSIAAGVLRAQGVMSVPLVDIGPWIDRYETDGERFWDRTDLQPVSHAPSVWWAVLWELARFVRDKALPIPPWPVAASRFACDPQADTPMP